MEEIVKIVVVDDSAFMRKMIADMIESRPNYRVVGKYKNGQELLDNIESVDPDIITLDIEMPILDGKETLIRLKSFRKKYTVIMLSSQTSKSSIHTLECLENGAIDFIQKPAAMSSDINQIKYELLQKIEASVNENRKNSKIRSDSHFSNTPHKLTNSKLCNDIKVNGRNIEAVVIGASTGGPKALQQVLPIISASIDVPVFVVQHMPKAFTKTFADRMDKLCKLKVVEAENNMNICKNTIYIAPGGYHMKIKNKDTIILSDEPQIWGVRPAVDKLFESAVKVYSGKLLSIILTGMGRDGAHGTEIIKDAGGITISEDESTCTIYGMPKAAYETGKVDMVLKLPRIGDEINTILKER